MRFKSVLGAILFILFASLFALIVFVQTKSFGGVVTRVISDLSEKRLATKVKINKISFSVFPPGLVLNKVRVSKKISETDSFQAELGTLGFYINLVEVEEKKITFGQIRLTDSVIDYKYQEKNEEITEIDQAIISNIFKVSDNLPVRIDTLLIENSKIMLNHELLDAKRLKIFKRDNAFITRFHLANIKPLAKNDFVLDELWGDAEITKKKIKIFRLKAQHDVHTILLKGDIANFHKLKGADANLNGEAQVHLQNLVQDLKLPENLKIQSGSLRTNFRLMYKNNLLTATSDVYLQDMRSNLFYADEVKASLSFENEKLSVNSLSLLNNNEKVTLIKPTVVYNVQTKKYLENSIQAKVSKLKLNNALRVLGPSLKPLKGDLSGDLIFEFKKGDLHFKPSPNFLVENLGLVVGPTKKPFTVLMIKRAILNKSIFSVINGEFQMNSLAKLKNSELPIEGHINKQGVHFSTPLSPIDLEDFGNISNLDIKGKGELAIIVNGPIDKTVINIKGKTKGFEILGYKLDETEKNLSIDLANSDVLIHRMVSKIGKTQLNGNGVVNYDNSDIALGITTNETNYNELAHILTPLFSDITFLPEDLDFKARIDADIFGKTNMDDLKLRSKVHFSDLTAYGENLNQGSLTISLLNRDLGFKQLETEKGRGTIRGDFSLNLKSKKMNLGYSWENLQFSQFNIIKKLGLNIDSQLSGSAKGSGELSDYKIKIQNIGFNTRTPNYKFKDSMINFEIHENRLIGNLALLGEIIKSDFNLSLKKGLASDFKFDFKSNDLKPFLVAIFGQHLESEEFDAKLDFGGSTTFQDGFSHLDLVGTLRHLSFIHPEFNVKYVSQKPEFLVQDSVIKSWNLDLRSNDLFLVTKGEGVFGKDVSLVKEFHVNSKILEILFSPILSAQGVLRNVIRINGRGTDFTMGLTSKGTDLDFTIDQLPIAINKLKYDIEYSDNRLMIQNISTSLDNGFVSAKGDVFFENAQPDVNVKFVFDRAEIPIMGKSLINLTGEGIVLGNNIPYNVSGDILVNNAQIVNELNEFSSKSSAFSQVRFLPKSQESILGKLFNLNLNVKIDNPARVTNSLMDVALKGEVRAFGNPSRPRLEGRIYTPVNTSRIFFKNNEYYITSADINFNPKKELSNPDFDIQAVTLISTYKVFPKVYGDLERFNFDLTSDPPLPRNSILSLIAFGYTDEIQSSLEAKDQQNLTQVGVGSFVFDRFKISDILNKQFGLQVNLGTVIEQSGTDSLLSGRSQEGGFGQGGGSLGRTRSATKIELKKRLDEALTLSVSSTMGGSIGQRQSMNLTYGLTKKIQLEGVYELRTNEEGQEDVIDNSIGGDLKFRWTFK